MLTQDIWNKFAPASVRTPISRNRYVNLFDWQDLPVRHLKTFEKITCQFAPNGVGFEDAIAIRPSNPIFMADNSSSRMVIMPTEQCRCLKVSLEKPISRIRFALIGSQEITVSALNAQGHCVATAKTNEKPSKMAHRAYPEQFVILNTSSAKLVRVDSKSPFVITRCTVKPSRSFT